MSKLAWTINADNPWKKPKSKTGLPSHEPGEVIQIVDGLEQSRLTAKFGVIESIDKDGRPILKVNTHGKHVIVNGWDVLWKCVTEEEKTLALLWGKKPCHS